MLLVPSYVRGPVIGPYGIVDSSWYNIIALIVFVVSGTNYVQSGTVSKISIMRSSYVGAASNPQLKPDLTHQKL
jgi:hypothetical protein